MSATSRLASTVKAAPRALASARWSTHWLLRRRHATSVASSYGTTMEEVEAEPAPAEEAEDHTCSVALGLATLLSAMYMVTVPLSAVSVTRTPVCPPAGT